MRPDGLIALIVIASVALFSCDSGGGDAEVELPQVFAYGDSIRGGLEPWLRRLSSEEAEIWTTGIFNGYSSFEMVGVLQQMRPAALPSPIPTLDDFEVVCLNAGIWDGSRLDPNFIPTTPAVYQENFVAALELIFELNPAAEVVLVTSTPPNPEFPNAPENEARILEYNDVLRELETVFPHVSLCDLHRFVIENADATSYSDGVHFTAAFSRELAGEVYLAIHSALARAAQD